jgi:hypothetical protein
MKFTLPISPDYVSHWGLWEAVRELYQNGLDEADSDKSCEFSVHYDAERFILDICTSKGTITPESLVLGNSTKRDDQAQRGKFGEGYKLALLVLARLGHTVYVRNGIEQWKPMLEYDETFKSMVLNIHTCEVFPGNPEGVEFSILGVKPEQWAELQRNIRPNKIEQKILLGESEKGRIYVGGLYVTTAKAFHCGYAFRAGEIKLDRDRGMVSGFDLAWATSQAWIGVANKKVAELLEADAPDVEYVEQHARESSPVVAYYGSYFASKYGSAAVPVSSQEEIERATNAGMKWVLVPEKVKSLYRMVKSWFIPTTRSPLEQLQEFRSRHAWRMDSEMKRDLDEIINSMSPKEARELVDA